MRTEDLRKEPKSVFDEYVETFTREGFPFTMFGKNAGKRGMLFDLTFGGDCSMLVHVFESDKDTVQGHLFDVIPYRNLDETTREKVLQIVNTNMKQESLFYDKTIHRFVIPVEISRNEDKDMRFIFRKIGERILLCFMPPGSFREKEMMKLSDGLRAVVDSSTQTSEDIIITIEPPLLDEFGMILKRKGYPVTRYNGKNRLTALVYCMLHKSTVHNVAMVEEKDGSVTAFMVYPIDFGNMPVNLVHQIVGGMQETINLGLGSVTYKPEIGEIHYVHRYHRKQFYPYEDLAEQIISLFEQEVEIALDVVKETAKKYGL